MSDWRTVLGLTLRSFLVQGSWNSRSLLGEGIGWVLDPFLRQCHADDPDRAREASRRLREPFNSHPYLSGVAIGALAELERKRAEPEFTRRFRDALRSPLGSLGDQFFWGALRPAALLLAITVGVVGAPPFLSALLFLLIYNLPHLALRFWGVRVGLELGQEVGGAVRSARLLEITERIRQLGVLVLGLLAGSLFVLLMSRVPGARGATLALSLSALVVWGFLRGEVVRRLAPWLLILAVVALLGAGPSFSPLP